MAFPPCLKPKCPASLAYMACSTGHHEFNKQMELIYCPQEAHPYLSTMASSPRVHIMPHVLNTALQSDASGRHCASQLRHLRFHIRVPGDQHSMLSCHFGFQHTLSEYLARVPACLLPIQLTIYASRRQKLITPK